MSAYALTVTHMLVSPRAGGMAPMYYSDPIVSVQDKLDNNFDIAFGIAGLAQLATGFALALIIAGENVSCYRMEAILSWVLSMLTRMTVASAAQQGADAANRTADGRVVPAGWHTEGASGVEGHQDSGAHRKRWRQPR